jgi:hypothetical protein
MYDFEANEMPRRLKVSPARSTRPSLSNGSFRKGSEDTQQAEDRAVGSSLFQPRGHIAPHSDEASTTTSETTAFQDQADGFFD